MSLLFNRFLGVIIFLWAFSGMGLILAVAYTYLNWPGFGEQGIVTFTTVSWLLAQDQPLYTAIDAAERYSLQHGPLIYLLISWSMKFFGPSTFSAKLPGVLFFTFSLLFSGVWLFKRLRLRQAAFLFGLECWFFSHWQYQYYSRPDSLLLLLLTIMMLFIVIKLKSHLQLLLLAFLCGLLINLKAHAVLYALPLFPLLWQQHLLTLKNILPYTGLSLVTALLPFLHPAISFSNYLFWLNSSLLHNYSLQNFLPKLLIILILSLIIICLSFISEINLSGFYKKHRGFLITLFFSMLTVSSIASKSGSGTNHLIPFIPMIIYIMVLILNYPDKREPATSQNKFFLPVTVLTLLLLVITVGGGKRELSFLQKMSSNSHQNILTEYYAIEDAYQGKTIAVGDGEAPTYIPYRDLIPLPVFKGNPFLIDAVALGDMNASGIPLPEKTLQALKEGKIQVWLIPSNHSPFKTGAYGAEFQKKFCDNYVLIESRHFFDIWIFKKATPDVDKF